MPTASYYREQARLLLEWAYAQPDPDLAKRLESRAQHYLALADAAEITYPTAEALLDDAIDAFNERQMIPPKKKDS
jgi:hypothetical protein